MKVSEGFKFALAAALGWAFMIILTRISLQNGENPYSLALWTGIFSIPFWVHLLIQRRNELQHVTKMGLFTILGMGLNGVILAVLEPFAIKYSSPINFSFLIRTVLLFTVIFATIFLHEKWTFKKFVLVILTTVGTYLLVTNGERINLSLGDGLTLLEAILIALGNNILGKLSTKSMSADLAAIGSFFVKIVPIGAIALLNSAPIPPKTPFLLLGITFFSIVVTMSRFRAYRLASASYVTMMFSYTPVAVSIIAVIFLGEVMTPTQLVGGALMILAGLAAGKMKI